jgi:hypothetical protein
MHAIRTARRATALSLSLILVPCLLLSSLVATLARGAEPEPSPHRFIPAKGLVAYIEFDGLAAHADAWKATAAHGLLVDTPAGSMMTALAKQLVDRLCTDVPGGKMISGDLIALHDHLIQRGFVVAVHELDGGSSLCTVVLSGFGAKPVRERLARLVKLASDGPNPTKLPAPVRLRGRDVYEIADGAQKNPGLGGGQLLLPAPAAPLAGPSPPWLTWWFEGDDLVLISGLDRDAGALPDPAIKKNPAAMLTGYRSAVFDVIEGKQPNVETHAAYISALAEAKDLKGFEGDGLFFVDLGSAKGLFAIMDGSLAGIKRIVGRWGFQGKALLTDVRVEAPAPRKGIVACLDQPAFHKDQLPPFPQDTRAFAVDSLDLAVTYQKIVGSLKSLEPELEGEMGQLERAFLEATGLRVREDLFNHLGPTWSLVRLPPTDRNRNAEDDLDPTEFALLAGVRDAEAFCKVLDSVASRINQHLREAEKGNDEEQQGKNEVDPPILALDRLPAPDRGYRLTSPARLVPWLSDEVQPTILVGKSFVACASNLDRAREALASESEAANHWTPAGELAQAFECLPDRLTLLIVGDHRESVWPGALAQLPATVQSLSAMLGGISGADPSTQVGVLSLFGVPGPGAFRLRIDPARIPKAEQVWPYLFPSVLAASVDDRGWRLISREAFPLACLGDSAAIKSWSDWTKAAGLDRKINLELRRDLGIDTR